MMFVLGVTLFAVGIAFSIAMHEAGHMWTARALGMKVRRFYIGFGPKVFSFRRGETEYGLKAIPVGGFCDIAGMTPLDELAPDEHQRAMYRQATWKRVVVMVGGIAMNIVLGFVLVMILAVGWGLPDRDAPTRMVVDSTQCAGDTQDRDGQISSCLGPGPAGEAGILSGDQILAINGVDTPNFVDVIEAVRPLQGTAQVTVDREGAEVTVPVAVQQVSRWIIDPAVGDEPHLQTIGVIGVVAKSFPNIQYGPIEAIPAAVLFTGDMAVETVKSIVTLPTKVVGLWNAVFGGAERAQDTPISVVGASVIGGQAAERGLWEVFVGLLAALNYFLAVFNMLPLLPLDGGHIAVTLYEKVRNTLRLRRGRAVGEPVDYLKLLPATYVVMLVGGAFMVLTLTADIVNPLQVFR